MPDYIPKLLVGLVLGLFAGLLVYFSRHFLEQKKMKGIKLDAWKIGRKTPVFLDEDFLINMEPGKLTITDIIKEYGDAVEFVKYGLQKLHRYNFNNACVQFGVSSESKVLKSVCLKPLINDFSIRCPLTPASTNDLQKMGEVKIDEDLIANSFSTRTLYYNNQTYAVLHTRFSKHPVSPLIYSYIVLDSDLAEKNPDEFLNFAINQICISTHVKYFSVIPE